MESALSGDDVNFPGVEVSGLTAFDKGRTDYVFTNLTPGIYVMADFLPTPGQASPTPSRARSPRSP